MTQDSGENATKRVRVRPLVNAVEYLAQQGCQIIIVPQTSAATELLQNQSSPTGITQFSSSPEVTLTGSADPLPPGVVDLRSLKRLVSQLLPSTSPVRTLILSEEDTLPAEEAFVKFGVYDRLLWDELKS